MWSVGGGVFGGRLRVLRRRQVADAEARVVEHRVRVGCSADRLRVERTQHLRAPLETARDRSRWHRARLSRVDVASVDEDRLEELPTMTKTDSMAYFDNIVTDGRVSLEGVNAHLA